MKKKTLLSIIVPVYNEKELILEVLKKLKELKFKNNEKEIIVIDDNSTDGTRELLKEKGLNYANKILYHDTNKGKGSALKTGFQEMNGDIGIVQDADFEYNPEEIQKVIEPILEDKADVVYGSRFLDKKYKGYKKNQLANIILTKVSNHFTGLNLTDMETCYKAFKKEIIKSINIEEKRFGFEPEITAKLAKKKIRVMEVPISYFPRTKEAGKKIRIKDGFRALYCIMKYK